MNDELERDRKTTKAGDELPCGHKHSLAHVLTGVVHSIMDMPLPIWEIIQAQLIDRFEITFRALEIDNYNIEPAGVVEEKLNEEFKKEIELRSALGQFNQFRKNNPEVV